MAPLLRVKPWLGSVEPHALEMNLIQSRKKQTDDKNTEHEQILKTHNGCCPTLFCHCQDMAMMAFWYERVTFSCVVAFTGHVQPKEATVGVLARCLKRHELKLQLRVRWGGGGQGTTELSASVQQLRFASFHSSDTNQSIGIGASDEDIKRFLFLQAKGKKKGVQMGCPLVSLSIYFIMQNPWLEIGVSLHRTRPWQMWAPFLLCFEHVKGIQI